MASYAPFIGLRYSFSRKRNRFTSVIAAVSGITLAGIIYLKKMHWAEAIAKTFRPLYLLSLNKFYFDEIYSKFIVKPFLAMARVLFRFDETIIDGGVNGTGYVTILISRIKNWIDTYIVDGFVNFALTSKGVEIGILFFELMDGLKISFRSKGEIPVNELASKFGGGGHLNASGTRLFNIKLKDLLPKVLSAAEDMVKKYNTGNEKNDI